jgi:hypothetical protein
MPQQTSHQSGRAETSDYRDWTQTNSRLTRRACRTALSLFILIVLPIAGYGRIALAQPKTAERTQVTYELSFQSARFGAAAQPYLGQIALPEGREREAVTYALVQALQTLEYSVVAPPIKGDTAILFDTPWHTDIVPLPMPIITKYNASLSNRSFILPPDRIYGLRYDGQILIRGAAIRLVLRSTLNVRGAQSPFRTYDSPYSGQFFADQLFEAFRATLLKEFSN